MADLERHEVGWECPACHLKRGPDKHDPCLGELPGVKYACCGHGGYLPPPHDGYIYFTNGKVIRFERLHLVYDHDGRECPITIEGE